MSRPTLVLLPGLLCDEAVWADVRPGLAPHAATWVPSYGAIASLGGMAEHVLAHAPAQRLALAGHSMGARVALEILRRAPARVERLALLDAGVDPLAPGEAGERERAQRYALLAIAQREGMRAMGAQWARGMVHPDRFGTPLFEQVLDMIERKTPAIFEAQIRAMLDRPDARPVLASAACPTLIACARHDTWSPLARHEQMHAMLPGSRLAVFEDSGHMAPMEQPQSVRDALVAWLAAG